MKENMTIDQIDPSRIVILPDKSDQTIEVHQKSMDNVTNLVGIILCAVIVIFLIIYLSHEGSIIWFLIICGTLLLEYNLETLFIRLLMSPSDMIIRGDSLTIYMLFNRKYVIPIADVDKMKSSTILTWMVPASGWLISSRHNIKVVIAKPFYESFDVFVTVIQKINPRCEIDGGLTDWVMPTPNPGAGM